MSIFYDDDDGGMNISVFYLMICLFIPICMFVRMMMDRVDHRPVQAP